jgi:precorrin-2 dehydrogenase/sirohydrochlorin ferrochelatase
VLPLLLDVSERRVAVIGRGLAAQQRYEYARDAGVERLSLYVPDQDGWACHAEAALYERLPVKADLEGVAIVLIAGLPADETRHVAAFARAAGALVNAEDQQELCDFHVPALVRRGDLVVSVSTGGKAPGLSQAIKTQLQVQFGPEWSERVRTVAAARTRWRAEGLARSDVVQRTRALIEREGWLRARELA